MLEFESFMESLQQNLKVDISESKDNDGEKISSRSGSIGDLSEVSTKQKQKNKKKKKKGQPKEKEKEDKSKKTKKETEKRAEIRKA